MRPALAIYRVTLRQLLAVRRTWALALLALVPAGVMAIATQADTAADPYDLYAEVPLAILLLLVNPVVSLLLGASAFGEERRQGTLSFLTLRPIRREVIAAAKLAAAWTGAAALSVGGGVAAALVLALEGGGDVVAPTAVAAAVNALGYAAVFVPLGLLLQRAVLGGLLYLFFWEAGLSFAVSALATFAISRIGLSAYAGMEPGALSELREPLGAVAPGAGGAVAKVAVMALVAVWVTAVVLRRRDQA